MIRVSRFASLAFALVLAVPSRADAQFGGLIKKAQDKVAEKAGPVAPGEQLTGDLVGKLLSGLQAADRVIGDRDMVAADREAKNKQLSAMVEKNGPVHAAYNDANYKVNSCRSSSFSELEHARDEKYKKQLAARQADPDFISKMQLISMKYAKDMAEAQKNNDAAALTKARNGMYNEMLGVDPFVEIKKDTVATDAKCGKPVTPPPALAQEEQLRKDISAMDSRVRTLEAQAVNDGAQAAGMERVRYTQLKERVFSIVQKLDGKGSSGVKFGDEETDAVKKRQGDIDKYRRAL